MSWNCPRCGSPNGLAKTQKMGFFGVATLTILTFGVFLMFYVLAKMMEMSTQGADDYYRKCVKCGYRIF